MIDYTLDEVKQDLYRILNAPSVTREEVLHLLAEIRAGHIYGETYIYPAFNEKGLCGCVVGTIALQRGILDPEDMDESVMGFHVWPYNPIEFYICGVLPGDTPENSSALANVAAWIEEWLGVREAVLL